MLLGDVKMEPAPRVVLPSFLAGPLVLLFLAAAQWASLFTDPIEVPLGLLIGGPMLLLIASAVGLVPALIANTVGAFVMIKAGNWFPLLRFPLVWVAVGGAAAWASADNMDLGSDWTFAFTAAGAICAFICRMRLE
jgi:hypothetical protein